MPYINILMPYFSLSYTLSSLFMVLWQSPDTPFLSCFLVSAWLRVCSSRMLSCLRALFHVGVWCSDPGTLVLFQAQFWFRVGVQTLTLQVWSCCGSLRSRVCLGRTLLCPCAFVVAFCCTQLVFQLHAFSCFVLFCVVRSLCFSLAACFHVCHVLCKHAAHESPY